MMRYSPSKNGFYPESNDYPDAPDDLMIITDELYFELLNGQAAGKIITPNKEKFPILKEQPGLTQSQFIEVAESRKSALISAVALAIAPLQDAVDLDIATEEETARLSEYKSYRVSLSRVDTSKAPEVDWPEAPVSLT